MSQVVPVLWWNTSHLKSLKQLLTFSLQAKGTSSASLGAWKQLAEVRCEDQNIGAGDLDTLFWMGWSGDQLDTHTHTHTDDESSLKEHYCKTLLRRHGFVEG